MAQRATAIFGDQIDISVAGLGLAKDVDDNFEVLVDDSTLEIALITGIGDALQVKDGGISESKLDALNAPVDGYALTWNSGSGQFEWVSIDVTDAVLEADVIVGEVPAGLIDGSNTTYTLANTPVIGTVAVYYRGIRQKLTDDYTIAGTTITFLKAPSTNSLLQVDYIIDN